jgi:hypothetical protein
MSNTAKGFNSRNGCLIRDAVMVSYYLKVLNFSGGMLLQHDGTLSPTRALYTDKRLVQPLELGSNGRPTSAEGMGSVGGP